MLTRLVAVLVLAGLLGALVPAPFVGAQNTDDRVAAARQRYLKRHHRPAKAKKHELEGLTEAGVSFLTFYLDVARNRKELRQQAGEKNQGVVDLPFLRMTDEDGDLLFRVYFQDLELGGVALPKADLEPMFGVFLGDPALDSFLAQDESHYDLRMLRLLMFAELLNLTAEQRANDPVVAAAFERHAPSIRLMAVDGVVDWAAMERLPAFEIVKQVGDAGTVHALAKRLEKEAKDLSPTDRTRFIGAICNIPSPAAEKFLLKILDGNNDARKARALRTLRRFPGDETGKRLAAILGPDSKVARKVQGGALRALEQIQDERALKILRDVFHASKEGQRRDKIGMALARRGDAEGLSYVMSRFEAMKDDGRKFRFACDMAQAGHRWVAPYLRKKIELAKAGKNEKVKAMLPLVRALLQRLEGPGAVK